MTESTPGRLLRPGGRFRYPRCVTSTTTRSAPRPGLPLATVGALAMALVTILVSAAPAHAEVPEGWSEPRDVSLFQLLTVIVGLPLVLVVLITAAVLLPALARGDKLLPHTSTSDQWFGGPDRSADELESRPDRQLGSTGGASGSW